jgi:PAS domain S-box-containing protein
LRTKPPYGSTPAPLPAAFADAPHALLARTLDAIDDGVLTVCQDTGRLYCNARFLAIWGIAADAIASMDLDAIVAHQLARVRDPGEWRRTVEASRARPDLEHRSSLELLDGRVLERSVRPQRVDGACVARVVVFRDITERLEHERERNQALRSKARQEATLASLINSISDLIFYKDRAGRFLGCNEAFAALVGRRPEEIRGLTSWDLFPPERARALDERDRRCLETLAEQSTELPGIYPDGTEVQFLSLVSPLWDEDGQPQGLVGISRNITARKEQEESVRRAKELAEEATRMKSDFLANISHEIRTPLNAVLGLSHLMLKTGLTTCQRDYAQKIQASGQHLLQLIATTCWTCPRWSPASWSWKRRRSPSTGCWRARPRSSRRSARPRAWNWWWTSRPTSRSSWSAIRCASARCS